MALLRLVSVGTPVRVVTAAATTIAATAPVGTATIASVATITSVATIVSVATTASATRSLLVSFGFLEQSSARQLHLIGFPVYIDELNGYFVAGF